MKNKSTDELDALLKKTRLEDIDDYYTKNQNYLAENDKAFYYYYKDTIEKKNIRLKDVYIAVDKSESYCGQIIRMEKHTDNRDFIISLCIAAHFLLDEINRALKLYRMAPLYAKDKRDACIIVAVYNRKYMLEDINDILASKGFDKLTE